MTSNKTVMRSTVDFNNILFGYDVTNKKSIKARNKTVKLNQKLRLIMK